MGDPKQPRVSAQLGSIVKGLEKNYPQLVNALGSQNQKVAEQGQTTREAIAPREQALSAGLYRQYAPQYGEVGSGVDLAALSGAGGQSVLAADRLDRQIDPEYYGARQASSSKLAQLLGGMNPNELTGAERENTARGLARSNYQSGETNSPSNQGAINAALTYGSALDTKRSGVANAINTATAAIPSFKSGKDAFTQATGGAREANKVFGGATDFGGNSSEAGDKMAENVLGVTSGINTQKQQLDSQRRTGLDTAMGVASSLNPCCFIFMEAYNGKLPWYVRECRDYWYDRIPELGEGYKKMAKWLVPMMQKSKVVRFLVNNLMVKPISQIGEYIVGMKNDYSIIDMTIHNTWFNIWAFMANKQKAPSNPTGKFAIIAYKGKSYVGNVLDYITGTSYPKRIRIQSDPEFQGLVVMPSEYTFKGYTNSTED
jgi:hypothetical protein